MLSEREFLRIMPVWAGKGAERRKGIFTKGNPGAEKYLYVCSLNIFLKINK
jgi:hypothetical protein